MQIELEVNGLHRTLDVWEGESLLSTLRERLSLWGSKNACEQGECGSCSVLLDNRLVCSCLVLAADAQGSRLVTVEGLVDDPVGRIVQQEMVAAGGVQCGFCTPGFVVAITDLLRHDPHPSDVAVREALAGNLCRCTGYVRILNAVQRTAARCADEAGASA